MASWWPTFLGFLLLTTNSAIAIHRSGRRRTATTLFVGVTYAALLLLFGCLRRFETAAPGSTARGRAKVGVWLTATLLTAMFSWRVAELMPLPLLAAAVWLTGSATVVGGFYALFLLPQAGRAED